MRRILIAVLALFALPLAALAETGPSPSSVLITGASRGIGFEFARQYAEAGWTVFATARTPQESEELIALAARHANVRLEQLDVIDADSIAALARRLDGVPIDVLINNAGSTDGFRGQSFGKLAHDRFNFAMELNAHGPIRVAEALYPNVLASQQKKIVAVTSLAGSFGVKGGGMPGGYWYKASKSALNMLMLSLAADVQDAGVSVAVLSPGTVDTQGFAARGITMPGTVDVQVSVGGMREVIAALTLDSTGTFIRYNGEPQPW